ncbi:CLUMA_CG009961, isoform A [Clunio marinus]|uniref:CLUMA_CG009961, isoform A n=1 Tax=Clunio marinus TaxID=568069 RepID=A0A1J1IDV1_9DIPT|nr:CLUMA_CG009961, isoform A [Clunio marinus]
MLRFFISSSSLFIERSTSKFFVTKIRKTFKMCKLCCPPLCPSPCPSVCKIAVPKSSCNPYAICDPLFPCDGCCVPVNPCGPSCQPFPTPGSRHINPCGDEKNRNKKYPQTCVVFPIKRC